MESSSHDEELLLIQYHLIEKSGKQGVFCVVPPASSCIYILVLCYM